MSPFSLFELNRLVRDALILTLPEAVWVMAELSEIRQASNGHYYVEFVEKDESAGGGKFLAKARGNIWHTTAATIIPKFFDTTGQHLQAGMKLLVEVRPTFHEVYGYTLTILDIDPTYTLGGVARRRQEILHQLEDDGVLTLNKELPLPRPLMRIAVISAAGAAGYGDFVHQLEQSGFLFHTRLFRATMQGSNVEMSIIAALNAIAAEHEQWDCVTILRGGGASSDLNGFETYLLAANVAQFPLPIFTGIGHERDDTVIDFVAHTRFKTPTAVAAFLIEKMQEETNGLETLTTRLITATHRYLQQHQYAFDRMAHRYEQAAGNFVVYQHKQLQQATHRLQISVARKLQQADFFLQQLPARLHTALSHRFLNEANHLERLDTALRMADPERILRMGYSLTFDAEGQVVRSVRQLKKNCRIRTQLIDGEVVSELLYTSSK